MSHHVCIDVDASDFDTDELVKELKSREKELVYEHGLTPAHWENLMYAIRGKETERVMALAAEMVSIVTGRIV